MSDYRLSDLEDWDKRIGDVSQSVGLDWFPIVYEMCDYHEMIGNMAYHGLPSHFAHWAYGKSFERIHQMYNSGMTGLPYELIINSNPSVAYLMRENPLYLQILIMAHCTGHSDFFKNNFHFSKTYPESIIPKMRSQKKRVQKYIENPTIGIDNVERILDAAYAIGFHTEHFGRDRVPHSVKKNEYIEIVNDLITQDPRSPWGMLDVDKVPLENDYDLLGFILEHGSHLEEWEKDLISMVRDESIYFIPQMRTKIINEGLASYVHYKIMNELDLPQEMHIPFLKSHNQVIRPSYDQINPYHLGFHLFEKIEKEKGFKECLFVREVHHDESAIREHVDLDFCNEMGLFSYSTKTNRKNSYISIDEVPDEDGWKVIRENLIMSVGINRIPKIFVDDLKKDGTLILRHEHDGRDLDVEYSTAVVKHISTLWEDAVKLFTILEEEEFEF